MPEKHQTCVNNTETSSNILSLLQFRRFALLQMTLLWWLDHHGFYLLVTFKFIQAFHILQGAACGWKCWWQSLNMLKTVSVSCVRLRYVSILLVVDKVIRTLYPKLIQSIQESDIIHNILTSASLSITACL